VPVRNIRHSTDVLSRSRVSKYAHGYYLGLPRSVSLHEFGACLRPTTRYNKARQLKESHDAFCTKAKSGDTDIGEFPEDLQWEPLSEVVRERVKVRRLIVDPSRVPHTFIKVQIHCYESVDLGGFVRVRAVF
jgi:hypothetical protein